MPRCINTVGCRNTKVQGPSPARPALHVPHTQPHPAHGRGFAPQGRRSGLHQEFQSHREGEEAAAGVQKGRGPSPIAKLPRWQGWGEPGEHGAQSQEPGGKRGVFVERPASEVHRRGAWSPVPRGVSENTGLGQCTRLGSSDARPGQDASGSWNSFLLGSENTLDRFSGAPKGNYGPRPFTGQYPCE